MNTGELAAADFPLPSDVWTFLQLLPDEVHFAKTSTEYVALWIGQAQLLGLDGAIFVAINDPLPVWQRAVAALYAVRDQKDGRR